MIINLACKNESEIGYEVIEFSDSHKHIKFETLTVLHNIHELTIKTRLASMDDVFILLQTVDACRNVRNNIPIHVNIAYLIGARYDRPMYGSDSFDLKIITDILNLQGFQSIVLNEPHSMASTVLLRALTVHPLDGYLAKWLDQFKKTDGPGKGEYQNICLASPDLGAAKRVEAFAKTLPFTIPIVYCDKDRDISTGKIKGMKVLNPKDLQRNILIYDDLCDKGGTFIGLAKEIKATYNPSAHITLACTHAILPDGVDPLFPHISKLITTNSYSDKLNGLNRADVDIHKII